jgi:hypothetical protein
MPVDLSLEFSQALVEKFRVDASQWLENKHKVTVARSSVDHKAILQLQSGNIVGQNKIFIRDYRSILVFVKFGRVFLTQKRHGAKLQRK